MKRIQSMRPVSYTHLDVYKRQALHCVFCQNENIANGTAGKVISTERLGEIFLELQEKGANNINLRCV